VLPWSWGTESLLPALPAPATLALSHSQICQDGFCFTERSAPLKAITGGMLVMQTCLNLSKKLSQLCN